MKKLSKSNLLSLANFRKHTKDFPFENDICYCFAYNEHDEWDFLGYRKIILFRKLENDIENVELTFLDLTKMPACISIVDINVRSFVETGKAGKHMYVKISDKPETVALVNNLNQETEIFDDKTHTYDLEKLRKIK